ncbi:MAG: DUF5312 family protein [Treponema sp.]|jgi:hypothetical protein|nr:DUF5312 family protein [Treponema sp.]
MKPLEFLARLFFFLAGSHDPETVKKRRLKQLVKELSRNRFSFFYKPKNEEITGALADFFYEIYRVISPAQNILQNATKSAMLKQIVAESFLDKNLEELRELLTEEAIEEQAKIIDIPELIKTTNEDIAAFSAAFDTERIKIIDRCYMTILSMARFVAFDFFAVLKKFDSRIVERDLAYKPAFTSIQGAALSGEIKDFLEIAFPLDFDENWAKILQILKIYRNGMDVVNYTQWNKVLGMLRDVRRSNILDLMVRHIDKNPAWQFKPKILSAHIAEKYLETKRVAVKTMVDKIITDRKKTRRDELVRAVFGRTEVLRAEYYTEEASEIFFKNHLDGYLYAAAINYLMAFLLDVFRMEYRDLCDLLLIRGQWLLPDIARESSEHFHLLMEQMDRLVAFDHTFSEMGASGSRLKTSIARIDREQNRHLVAHTLSVANEEALEFIHAGVRSITVIGRNLDAILKDRQGRHHTLITNWQELDLASAGPLPQRIAAAVKQAGAFVQLMAFLIRSDEEAYL